VTTIFDLASFLLRHHRRSGSAGRDEEYRKLCGWFRAVTMGKKEKKRKGANEKTKLYKLSQQRRIS